MVGWVLRLGEFWSPPQVGHVKEAPLVLKHPELGLEEEAIGAYFEKMLRRNNLTRFLDRHTELVPKLSGNFDNRRLKQGIQRLSRVILQRFSKYGRNIP